MTFEQLSESLPNGLHDAEWRGISIDYAQQTLTMDLVIWVGSMDDPPETREAYREGRITVSGLLFCIMEPPEPTSNYRRELLTGADCPTIDDVPTRKYSATELSAEWAARVNSVASSTELLKTLPQSAFVHTLFVFDWNSCVHIAATDAELKWMGPVNYRA